MCQPEGRRERRTEREVIRRIDIRAGNVNTPSIPKRVFVSDLFSRHTALVTGGGTDLGRVIAQTLAEAGADLLLAARRIEVLDAAAAEIRAATGRRVETCVVNIRDRAAVEALAEQAHQRFGALDILINHAGCQFAQVARDFSPKGWNAVIETNLTGTWNMTQEFGAQMLAGQGGSIINITAVTGRGFPGIAHTAPARAGDSGTNSLALSVDVFQAVMQSLATVKPQFGTVGHPGARMPQRHREFSAQIAELAKHQFHPGGKKRQGRHAVVLAANLLATNSFAAGQASFQINPMGQV